MRPKWRQCSTPRRNAKRTSPHVPFKNTTTHYYLGIFPLSEETQLSLIFAVIVITANILAVIYF